MKNFRTNIQPEQSKDKISYHTPVLFLGSCFTENIGNKMQEFKFPAIVNPFGVLYNPVSVRKGLGILIDNKRFTEEDLLFFNEQWFSFYHDTEFSDPDKEKALIKINASIKKAAEHLRRSKFLVITFGTAWVFNYLKTDKVVSNCHKIPAKEFKRFRLEVEDIFVEWANLISRLSELNPDLKIIFTVSPVRHWKDGAIQNQISKSSLILAIHQLKERFENVEYFPAYEIMMDDLRDYRFYADDMLHPSKIAIDYIWEYFSKSYFEDETIEIIKEVGKIIQAKNHKPFNNKTLKHRAFLETHQKKIGILKKKYSFLDFYAEEKYFSEK